VSDLLTTAGAAAFLGVSRQTLHRWEAAGVLRRAVAGGPPRYTREHLAEVAAGRADAGPAAVRRRVLAHAAAVVAEAGPAACTVEAVADRAGLSRGGVLHHFRHRADLVLALARAFTDEFERDWDAAVTAAPPGGGRLARGYVAATRAAGDRSLAAAVLLCTAQEPAVREHVHGRVRDWYARLAAEDEREDRGGRGVTCALAADGLWLLTLLHLPPLPPGAAVLPDG
jgi:AcrR family transcriptional regulator